ncbi:MAG: hypothetical protein AAF434_16080 [Pseudomonadota bacterium]
MSQLQLSAQLVRQLHGFLSQHDKNAEDPGVASQYMAATIGFLLGEQDMDSQDKEEILEQLFAFAQHVAEDVERQKRAAPPKQNPFGVWKPGMS